jgi:Zn-dependent protease
VAAVAEEEPTMEGRNSIRVGRVAGIDIRVHSTWLIVFALVSWSLAQGYFPSAYPGWDTAAYWLAGVVSALALFASVLVHELAHSLVAQARGLRVRSITLFIFGGVSNLTAEATRPQDEFLISIVGPLSSFLLAAAFWAAGASALAPAASTVGAVLGYLAFVNLLLGAFNLVPGFPLDGGRVLRSIIWAATGSLRRATQIASFVGQGAGWALIFWGVSQALGGALLNGMWTAFVGWFLNGAAESARQEQALRESLRGVRVADLMDPRPVTASPQTSIHEFVFGHVLREGRRSLLVVEDGQLRGLVSITDAKEVPQEAWAGTPVARIMTPVPLKTVPADAGLDTALRLLVEQSLNQVPVLHGATVVGLLSRADILRYLRFREELDIKSVPAPGRPAATAAVEGRYLPTGQPPAGVREHDG